jgi:DNA polymerase phi
MSGEEVRDMLFGRLFGLMSIVASGMMTRESTQTEDIVRMIESLHDMATAKSYLAEVCHHVVVNILPHVRDKRESKRVCFLISFFFFLTNIVEGFSKQGYSD